MSKEEIEAKTISKELNFEIEKLRNSSYCKHCRKNPQAEKPFSKMKRIAFNEKQQKILEVIATQYKVDPGCVLCLSIENFMKLPNDAKRLEWLKGKN
jgi:hypothetical protein